jgi:hypothetical protein
MSFWCMGLGSGNALSWDFELVDVAFLLGYSVASSFDYLLLFSRVLLCLSFNLVNSFALYLVQVRYIFNNSFFLYFKHCIIYGSLRCSCLCNNFCRTCIERKASFWWGNQRIWHWNVILMQEFRTPPQGIIDVVMLILLHCWFINATFTI